MASNNLRNRYIQDRAGVVSQQKLLVMLYDRLILDCEHAMTAIADKQWEASNDKLQHAQAIVLELASALDTGAWEGGQSLLDLYTWFDEELTTANVKKDAKYIKEPLKLIKELRDTWNQALTVVAAEQAQAREAGTSTFTTAAV